MAANSRFTFLGVVVLTALWVTAPAANGQC